MRRVLLTGSSGFTGHYLGRALSADGWTVIGAGTESSKGAISEFIQVDLTQADDVVGLVDAAQPDAVVHLAALSFVEHNQADDFYRVNLLGTRNLLSALANSSKTPSSVILASSANVYGNQVAGRLDEETLPNPVNDYGVSKLAMEYMARLWCGRLPITLTRPFNYTGRGQPKHFLLPKIVEHFRQRAPQIELGNLDVWRDFADVRAITQAYVGLLEHQTAGQVYNLCSGRLYSLREILSMMEQLTGYSMLVRSNPDLRRASEVKKLCGDPGRLQRLLGGWSNPPLEDTLQWMLQEKD